MPNITMTIDGKTLKKARKIAVEKNTTLTAMVRGYLEQVTEREENRKEEMIKKLKKSFHAAKIVVGEKKWKRDDLYDR